MSRRPSTVSRIAESVTNRAWSNHCINTLVVHHNIVRKQFGEKMLTGEDEAFNTAIAAACWRMKRSGPGFSMTWKATRGSGVCSG